MMNVSIYIAARVNVDDDYITMVYNLCSHLYTWRYLISNWKQWSFSEKKTDRICYKLNKNMKYGK